MIYHISGLKYILIQQCILPFKLIIIQCTCAVFYCYNLIGKNIKNMRNQAHKQRQNMAHNSISHNNYLDCASQDKASKQKHKSICFIHIKDITQSQHLDQNKCFRNTFFGKLGKRVSPKKNFFNTMMDKLKQNSNYQSMVAQKIANKSKEGLTIKNYSQRSSFIIKQISPSHAQMFGKEAQNLLTLQKDDYRQNKANIIEDIEKLRFTQSGYIELLRQKQEEINEDQQIEDKYIQIKEQTQQQQRQYSSKLSKEDIIISLREKIRNKQSKKHIYHTLKSKNQAWNKIRIKTHPHFNNQSRNNEPEVSYQIQSIRLHCRQPKDFIKHAYSKNSKSLNPPSRSINELKIESKPCNLSFNIYDPPSLIPFSKESTNNATETPQSLGNKLKTKREMYQQIISSVKSTNKNSLSQRCQTGNNQQPNNQFRILTPWKNDYDDLF